MCCWPARSTVVRRWSQTVIALVLCSTSAIGAGKSKQRRARPQCAQWCVHHVCSIVGVFVPMARIMQAMPPRDEGNDLLEVKMTLEWVGLRSRAVESPFAALCATDLPAVAHTRDHFIVVEAANAVHSPDYQWRVLRHEGHLYTVEWRKLLGVSGAEDRLSARRHCLLCKAPFLGGTLPRVHRPGRQARAWVRVGAACPAVC